MDWLHGAKRGRNFLARSLMRKILTILLVFAGSVFGANVTDLARVSTIQALQGMQKPTDFNVAETVGRLVQGDRGGGKFVFNPSSTAATNTGTIFACPYGISAGRWIRQYSGALDVTWFGAKHDGVTDDFNAITSAIGVISTNVGNVYFPVGHYVFSDQIILPSGISLIGDPPVDLVFGGKSATSLIYSGSASPSIVVIPPAGIYYETITIANLEIDGSGLSGGATIDGIGLLGTSGSGAGVRGVVFDNVTIKNFPRYQVWLKENIFHVMFDKCNLENRTRTSGNDLVRCEGGAVGQLTYNHCWFSQATVGHWCHYGATHEARFVGGTVEAAEGANGIYVENSGIDVLGTHVESYNPARTDGIGIRYVGNLGGTILPSNVSIFGIGIQIGNPSSGASDATGVMIGGGYSGNNIGAGGKDLHIVAGGSRKGVTVLPSGTASSTNGAIVLNERYTVDGSFDVIRLDTVNWQANAGGGIDIGGGTAASVTSPALNLRNDRILAWYDHNGAKTLSMYVWGDTNDNLVFGSGNATRMWLDKNGHLGIAQSSPHASALLDLSSTTLGFLPMRMTTGQRNAISSPDDGLMVEDVTGEPSFRVSGVWKNYGTVNSVGMVGTANEITITGTSPIVNAGSFTASFPSGHTGSGAVVEAASPTITGTLAANANITMSAAKLISITSGSNQRAGDATLVGGTITVANTTVTSNTRVFVSRKTAGGTIGSLAYSLIASTSFTITSDNALDTSVVSYFLIEVP